MFVGQLRETVSRLHALPGEPVPAAEREELLAAYRSRRVIAYKFLQAGRVAPFSGVTWPEGGA